MSDGYHLYCAYFKRLRCWVHLIRKAKGLCDSYTEEFHVYGQQVHDTLNHLINAIYQAREGSDEGMVSISVDHQKRLENLRTVYEEMSASPHQKKHGNWVGNSSMTGRLSFACSTIPPGH